MASDSGGVRGLVHQFHDRVLAVGGDVPERQDLPWYVAPVPAWLEDVGLSLAWLVVAVNLVGTAFGFWYYRFQFGMEPVVMWPFVPDSPAATLFIALSIAAWKLGRQQPWLDALAFFGCIKLGAWTPFVLLAYFDGWSALHPAMYHFLFWSHLAMVVQAFVIYRYSDFPVGAVFVAVVWYGLNDVVDYFIPVVGGPHHTLLPESGAPLVLGAIDTVSYAAVAAVTLTLLATFLALATRAKKAERGYLDPGPERTEL